MKETMESASTSCPAAKTALEAHSDQDLRVPCYCEENVWRLAYRRLHFRDDQNLHYYVLFISNPNKCVPMFQQLAAKDRRTPVFWDYHVILLETHHADKTNRQARVLDIDSHLPYECALPEYVRQTFPDCQESTKEFAPMFR